MPNGYNGIFQSIVKIQRANKDFYMIHYLKNYLENVDKKVHISPDDADLLTANTAREEEKGPCVIVAEDKCSGNFYKR